MQIPPIKADASAGAGKDKDAAVPSLDAEFTSYMAQMMSFVDPGPQSAASISTPVQAPVQAQPAAAQPKGRVPDKAKDTPSAAAPAQAGDQGAAGTSAAAAQSAPAQSQTAAASAAPAAQTAASASAADGATPAPATKTAVTDPAPQAAVAQGKAAPAQVDTAPAPAPPPAQAQAAPAAAPAAPADSRGNVQASSGDDITQVVPDLKLQVQYGAADPGTAKAPLTEFVNQVPVESATPALAAAVQDALQPANASALGATALAQTVLAAGTVASQAQPTPTAAGAGGADLAASAASAQAGAAAVPGAFGAVRVTAAASSQAQLPLSAQQQGVLSQVDGTIRWLVKNQDKGAELQLHPESLGRVQVQLKVDGNVVHARVWASEASAVPLLQNHKSFLESSLQSQGLTLGSFDLQQGRRQEQAPLPEQAQAAAASPVQAAVGQESPDAPAAVPASSSRIEFVA